MKIWTNKELTGHAQLDKYLVDTRSPLDTIIVYQPEMPFPDVSCKLYDYAKTELSQEDFKDFMEKAYPGGFKRQLDYYFNNHYFDNRKVTITDFFCFVKTLLETRIWLDEVIAFAKTSPFEWTLQQELDDYIRENNLQAY